MNTVNCKIERKNDFASGAYLIAKILQNKVDKNALYTISAEAPSFILPFTYKNIDGETEIIYDVGNLSKLTYFKGELDKDEYALLWVSLLEPLLDCGDWFLSPDSFVLNIDHLYYDKRKKSAVYVYVPSLEYNADKNAFNDMVAALSKVITVSDTALENKMLRSIVENSSPREFLEMLKEHTAKETTHPVNERIVRSDAQIPQGLEPVQGGERSYVPVQAELPNADDLPTLGMAKNEQIPAKRGKKESGRFKLFGTKSKKKKEPKPTINSEPESEIIDDFTGHNQRLFEHTENIAPQPQIQTAVTEITDSIPIVSQKVSLKCVGKAELPQLIDVALSEGDIFSIGRYDASVGKPQSSFEFDKKTKAVSRRHAVIEREGEAYMIIDLSSRAGTFVDGQKLPPNTPYQLSAGTRVSFGNFGADYIWEISYHAGA